MPVTSSDIDAAARRIEPYIRKTPLLDLPPHELGTARSVQPQLEFLQHAGSCKSRAEFNSRL